MAARRFPVEEAPSNTTTATDGPSSSSSMQVIEESLAVMHGGSPPFKWVEDDGQSLIGCYAPLSYTPSIAREFFQLARLVYGGTVKPRYRELAILAVFSVLDAPYAVYCHRGVAARVGFTAEQYEEGLKGQTPRDLTDAEGAIYRLARKLTMMTGPLDDEAWHEAREKLERVEIVGVVHVIAGYRWVAMLEQVNGEDRRWS